MVELFVRERFFSAAFLPGCVAMLLLTLAGGLKARTFCVNYSPEPDAEELLAYDIGILGAQTNADLAAGQALGRQYLGYISLVEVADGAHLKAARQAGLLTKATNPVWKGAVADVTNPAWKEFVLQQLAKPIAARGFDGFFLDTADSVALVAKSAKDRARCAMSLVDIVRSLRAAYPDKQIVINRGFDLLPDLGKAIDGVLIESVFRSYDFKKKAYIPTAPTDSKALVEHIHRIKATGREVYVLDYVAEDDSTVASETLSRIVETGASAYLATPNLDGTTTGPVVPESRRILVLFGHVEEESEGSQVWAADTMTAERLQMPLEWLGYELEYVNIGKVSPPETLGHRFAGVIFDAELQLPYAGEAWYVDWVLKQTTRGKKVLFAGEYPFQREVERARLFQGLGIWGSFNQVKRPSNVKINRIDESIMNFEAPVTPHPVEITDLRAPIGSNVFLSVSCFDERANAVTFDGVYAAPWGGALLEPYFTFQASSDDTLSLVDPFGFLTSLWPEGQFPAPDTSTRAGRRIFYSHIDGDGFAGYSYFNGDKICAEIVRDEILKKYPFPITVSVVEANVRAMEVDQDPTQRERYEEVARTIFEMPQIEAASHAFSHPYVWIADDEGYIPLYDRRNLKLQATVDYPEIGLEREIAGSISYIEEQLLPADKKVKVMLWSGNCRPGAEALKITQRLGIENMNGGNTVVSRKHSWIANVAPRVMLWDGELQIHAANQNEFVYTNDWKGPFFGGFSQVIDTFERTEGPRRLKPANIYYHFYSASRLGALRSLQKVYNWCVEQDLHAITASEFAQLTRDSYQTQLFRAGEDRWVIVNDGLQTTFRLPKDKGVPDMAASRGVIGYNTHNDWIYVHTSGTRCTELVLGDENAAVPNHLYLRDSIAPLNFTQLNAESAEFISDDLRENYQVNLAGAQPGSHWKIIINGKAGTTTANAEGVLRFLLTGESTVSVTLARSQTSITQNRNL
ncbi:MAG: hypothetical protein ACI9R3_000451 [Verrucomicrobiales bacterium]|jgi:hypothetical protein